MKFDVTESHWEKDFYIHLSCSMNKTNPLEVEEDLKQMTHFLKEKYIKKEEKRSFSEYMRDVLNF